MNGLMMRWPEADAQAVPLLKEVGVGRVWLSWEAPGERRAFLEACHAEGVRVIAELNEVSPGRLEEARAAGFDGVAVAWLGDESGWRRIEAEQTDLEMFVLLDGARIGLPTARAWPVLRGGLWPGARRAEPGQASATQRLWLDSNVHLIAWLRAMFPHRPALLGYRPDEAAGVAPDQRVPFWTTELALVEASVAGGGVVVTLPEPFRKALSAAQEMAREAWESLVRTSRFLREHAAAFQPPVGYRVAALVGPLEECQEVLNLMYRFNVTPAVWSSAAPGPLHQYRVLVALGLGNRPQACRAVLDFARSGGTVLAVPASENESPWWRVAGLRKIKSEDGRDIYSLGRGTLIAYRTPVLDPGEFAEDVLDAQGWTTRDLRIWGTDAVIGLLRRQAGGQVSVELINYGGRAGEFLLRLEGRFGKADLHLPGQVPRSLRAAVRGSGTEIEMPRLPRVARVVLA